MVNGFRLLASSTKKKERNSIDNQECFSVRPINNKLDNLCSFQYYYLIYIFTIAISEISAVC